MNLPNKLTLTRIILVPVFMIFVSLSQYMTPSYNPRWYLIAGIIIEMILDDAILVPSSLGSFSIRITNITDSMSIVLANTVPSG